MSFGSQSPFDADNVLGENSFRTVTESGPFTQWQVSHGHYDTRAPQDDYNTVFPIDILRTLASNGAIGSFAEKNFTFMGYQTNPELFYDTSAPQIRDRLLQLSVDGVLLVPG